MSLASELFCRTLKTLTSGFLRLASGHPNLSHALGCEFERHHDLLAHRCLIVSQGSIPPTSARSGLSRKSIEGVVRRAIAWDRKDEIERAKYRRRLFRIQHCLANFLCLFPLPLTFLLTLFDTDKHRTPGHRYGNLYASCFRPFRYGRIKLLEIGIGGYRLGIGGNSLLAWQAYFPLATIIGCDIEPREFMASAHTRIYRLGQSSRADLALVRSKEGLFDIVIDDGSHQNAHQLLTFVELIDAVRSGGIYVIEDVCTSYWEGARFGGIWDGKHPADPAFRQTCMGTFLEIAKLLNQLNFARK